MNNLVKIVHFSVKDNKDKNFYLKFPRKCCKSGIQLYRIECSADILKIKQDSEGKHPVRFHPKPDTR
jgi:hypothetical protein